MNESFSPLDFQEIYERFDTPITAIDCGAMCAPHNPSGKPFCCDIRQAVPAAYHQEWEFLRRNTDLWKEWHGNECPEDLSDAADLLADTPEHMLLLACQGAEHCQRKFRAVSCRQFPFFPYVTSDFRFIGLAYEWAFEPTCWVISHLELVSTPYQKEFISLYDDLFSFIPGDFESYAIHSEEMRTSFAEQKRRIPILHRNGNYYLLSPLSERLRRIQPELLSRFGVYQEEYK
jgi:hypothetical protein